MASNRQDVSFDTGQSIVQLTNVQAFERASQTFQVSQTGRHAGTSSPIL